MLSLKQKSTRTKSTVSALAGAAACAAALAVPATGLAAPPELSFDPASHEFGLQPVYDTAQTTFQLRNEGAEDAWLESLQIVGPDAGSFWVGNSTCWSGPVQPAEACSVDVYFNPGEPGREYAAQLRATSAGIDFDAGLSGTGASPYFTSEPNPVDFGSAKVGGEGNTREIEVVNAGNWPGGLFIAVISGGAVGSYQLLDENCTNRMILPAGTCTAQVRFRPIAEGAKKATLSLFGEGDGGSQIVLSGIGAASDPVPQPATPPASASAPVAAMPASAVAAAGAAVAAELRTWARRAWARSAKARRLRARRARARRARARRRKARAQRAAQRRRSHRRGLSRGGSR